MCGIVGVISGNGRVDPGVFQRMRDSFPYRGPDDADSWFLDEKGIALGHRRLSIIDPRPSGKQPMVDEDTGNRIVFNGEVFNYLEIREDLKAKGYKFATGTDTEVILKAYREYGVDCLKHFNGMFAIAIWDMRLGQLFLARDRLGIKPLYYVNQGKEFVFASEVKAIKLYVSDLTVDPGLVDQYMTFGYVPGSSSMLSQVKRLMGGEYAIYKDGKLSTFQYWDVDFSNEEDLGLDHYMESTKELLLDSINLRLRSDVPLGIFLSGGIDSSAVVSLLADKVQEPLKTFSVAYNFGEQYNETRYARMVSEKFSTEHHEIFVEPSAFKDFVPEYVRLMDEPVTEAAAISLYFVSKLAKDHVTVVLSGEGSDELFAGYDLYRYNQNIERLRSLFGPAFSSLLFGGLSRLGVSPKIRKYASLISMPFEKRYRGISTYDVSVKPELYSEEFTSELRSQGGSQAEEYLENLFQRVQGKDIVSQMLYFDTKTWLVDDLLIKADRMSMAASLELRVPFLDYRLVEHAAKIPTKYKIADGKGKFILKKIMEPYLPNEIIYRKKMGFPTPLNLMFKGELKNYATDVLTSREAKVRQYFKPKIVSRYLDEHISGKHDHHRLLWQLLVLNEWLEQNG